MTLALLKPLGVLLLVTACAGRSTESPRTSRSSEAVPATELANRRGDGPDPEASLFARDINVPTITVGRPLPESALPLVIGPDAVRIGVADPSVVPLPSREVQAREGFGLGSRRHGLHGYVVLPLASALSEATCAPPPPLAVYADATTPYKVLLETLMTARRVGFKQTFWSDGTRMAATSVSTCTVLPTGQSSPLACCQDVPNSWWVDTESTTTARRAFPASSCRSKTARTNTPRPGAASIPTPAHRTSSFALPRPLLLPCRCSLRPPRP